MNVSNKINKFYKVFSFFIAFLFLSFLGYKHFFLNESFTNELIIFYLQIIFVSFGGIIVIWILDLIFSSALFNPK
jgi:hypothetical protein